MSEVYGIVPRDTIEDIVEKRNRALQLYEEAHDELNQAQEKIFTALSLVSGEKGRYNYHAENQRVEFLGNFRVPDRDLYLKTARRILDTDVWQRLLNLAGIDRWADKTAKSEFHSQLMSDPPEVTLENVTATLRSLFENMEMMFQRGIARAFSDLDRRFKSHDGWKIGGRIILTNAFDQWGSWNYYAHHEDTLCDVERVFYVLDKEPVAQIPVVWAINQARGGAFGKRRSFTETPYFKVRVFENGNLHIWFKRDDLVTQVNKILAAYYGEVLADGASPEEHEDGGLNTPKTSLARNFGFFPTPERLVQNILNNYAPVYGLGNRILEPSAGTGNFARPLAMQGQDVTCVEIQPHLADSLQSEGLYAKVITGDFLSLSPEGIHPFDLVYMNPPFDRERDIDHVMHALKFLRPEGTLVAIMSAGTEFRETRKASAFRDLVEKYKGRFQDLPERSFSDLGTNVNTILLTLRLPKEKFGL